MNHLTDGMEMGFLFHEYKHAVTKYELTKDPWLLLKQKEIEKFMQTAKPFPKLKLDRSYD